MSIKDKVMKVVENHENYSYCAPIFDDSREFEIMLACYKAGMQQEKQMKKVKPKKKKT